MRIIPKGEGNTLELNIEKNTYNNLIEDMSKRIDYTGRESYIGLGNKVGKDFNLIYSIQSPSDELRLPEFIRPRPVPRSKDSRLKNMFEDVAREDEIVLFGIIANNLSDLEYSDFTTLPKLDYNLLSTPSNEEVAYIKNKIPKLLQIASAPKEYKNKREEFLANVDSLYSEPVRKINIFGEEKKLDYGFLIFNNQIDRLPDSEHSKGYQLLEVFDENTCMDPLIKDLGKPNVLTYLGKPGVLKY